MKRSSKVFACVLIVVALVFSISGCGKSKGKVVAKVGDRKIYIDDVTKFFDRTGQRFISADAELKAKRDFIDTAIANELLVIGGYEKNADKADEVKDAVEGEKDKFLLDVLFDKEIISKAQPSEAEMKDWYDHSKEEVKASHILVKTKKEAEDILKQLKDGTVFEDLAVKYSIDPSVRKNQGDLGWFSWGVMIDAFQEAAFAMKPGEVSAPIKTSYGYHIIKVVDKRKADLPPYAQVKEQIRTSIIERRKRGLMQEYVEKLKKKYPITVEKPTCQFVLNKLQFLYPDTIAGHPRWRNNIDPQQLDPDEKALVLGRYEGGKLTIGQYLANINRIREERRPDFDQYDSLASLIFQMSLFDILAVEARAQGLDKSEKYLSVIKRFRERAMADVMRYDTLANEVEVNDGEVQAYYDTHLDEFKTPLRFHLLELQVATEKEANKYRKNIRTEAQFKRAAKKYTLRPGKRAVSGDLGIITREQYPDLFDLANKTTGHISKPININGKWSIVWIKKRLEPEQKDFAACKYEISNKLLKEKVDAHFKQWIEDMKKRIPVEVYEDVLSESIDHSKYAEADTTQASQ